MKRTRPLLLALIGLLSACASNAPSTSTSAATDNHRAFDEKFVDIEACRNWTNLVNRERTETERKAAIYMDLGVGYWQQGSYSIALKELNRSIELDPNSAAALNARALLNQTLGHTKDAKRDFRKSLRLEPGNPNTHNNYGTFICDQGDFHQAVAHFECAIASPLYRTPYLAFGNAGACAAKSERPQRAINYLRTAIQLEPRYATAYVNLAEVYVGEQKYLRARESLKQFDTLSKPTAKSLYLGYKTEFALGDKEAAAKLASRLKFQFPNSDETDLLMTELTGG